MVELLEVWKKQEQDQVSTHATAQEAVRLLVGVSRAGDPACVKSERSHRDIWHSLARYSELQGCYARQHWFE